ncbi:hypothetical protein [Actinomadura sp. 21ATH]|uniref:hypothetical protein n=1 Tax=Actinomadura sp. 21ATH TaxID=1735444 RepID=UPI0035BFF6A7
MAGRAGVPVVPGGRSRGHGGRRRRPGTHRLAAPRPARAVPAHRRGPRPARRTPVPFGWAAAAGGAVLCVLWSAASWPAPEAGTAVAAAQLAALGAGYGALLLVVLLLRVPAAERMLGGGRSARRRRRDRWCRGAAASTIALVLLHAVPMTAGRPGGTVRFLGWAAAAAAVLGAVLLVRAGTAAGRGPAVPDRVACLVACAGTALGFAHQPVGSGAGARTLAAAWTLLHVQVLILVIWYRLLPRATRPAPPPVPGPGRGRSPAVARMRCWATLVWLTDGALAVTALAVAALA